MKKTLLTLCTAAAVISAQADTLKVNAFRHIGPLQVMAPVMVDSVDVHSQAFAAEDLLDTHYNLSMMENAPLLETSVLPGTNEGHTMHLLGFAVENTRYTSAEFKIAGMENYRLYVDGKEIHNRKHVELEPQTHQVVLKVLATAGQTDSLNVSIETPTDGTLSLREDGRRMYTLKDVLFNTRYSRASLSANGRYLLIQYSTTNTKDVKSGFNRVIDLKTGNVVAERWAYIQWMPKSNLFYYLRKNVDGKDLVTVNPANGKENILATNVPEGYFQIAPTEDYLLYTLSQNGPEEREEIYQILEPEDRQPGWRTRSYMAKYDLKTQFMQPVSFGYHNCYPLDISEDGRYVLAMTSRSRLTARPTVVNSLLRIDLQTLRADTLVEDDGFIANAGFSPDGKQIYITGSAEALGGIGMNLPEGRTPNMFEYQMYVMNLTDRQIMPITKDFDPSVKQVVWSRYDNQIYFTAENRDYVDLYRYNTKKGKMETIATTEDLTNVIALADEAPVMAYYGQSASNSDRLYTISTDKLKETLIDDLSSQTLKGVELGECHAWNFESSRGDTIYGRYYLPPHFDANKKYPMIVNYYGGCSPTGRRFESRYPHHVYASLGYVVYVVQPSGASGFGQEFGSRHVNTAGNGPAQDIIEGTKLFCKEHAFVNPEKIGCIGASYGGFMTQYLQTQTDIFAAAISHAGISDHTSYWGEGYWGYSYSEVSMAHSYPWSHKELYVDQSPLYNADKIHTPILFLHGDSDHNVPVGESIQLYTALKLLGCETALVLVEGQDHQILDNTRRQLWEKTIYAWFAKWLQDDDTWWNEIYSPKAL